MSAERAAAYWSPYTVGVGLGGVVLASYVVFGFGPGASGAFAHVAARVGGAIAPDHAAANSYLAGYLASGRLWAQWIVVEMLGVVLGGFLAAWTAGRLGWRIVRGRRLDAGGRLVFAFAGGAIVGFASRVAQGCTSGLALSGGAVLAPGAWAFLAAFMAAGIVTAWIVKGAWR